MKRSILVVLAVHGAIAWAQPPVPPPPSDAGQDAEAFRADAAARYRAILARLASTGRLDDERNALDRVRRVAAGLIVAARDARPSTASWAWEVHVTSDPAIAAFCIAGGKILVGSAFVDNLDLTDAELAMLLGHEIAHAVAGHRRAAPRAGVDSDAAEEIRQTRIAVAQENEADEIGMDLAHRAGWPLAGLVAFYDKLAAREASGTFSTSHPSAAARAVAARAIADRLGDRPR